MIRKLLSALFITLFLTQFVWGQTGGVRGTITDASSGEEIPTANILLVEIERGTASDIDGNYSILNIPAGTYTMRVTFVGYKTQRIQVQIEPGTTITQDIQLESGAIGLDELVVTGYGAITKRELTGSITSVNSREFEDIPLQNVESILQGRAAGVQVTTTSGNPGGGFQVRVRGVGSIQAGSDPLYIVDGVQISTQQSANQTDSSPLNSINPNDIESIEVLKDAAAAAIYGAQAGNGVVLITTKRGAQGPTQITAKTEYGVRSDIKRWDLLSTTEWLEFNSDIQGEATVSQGLLPFFGVPAGTPFDEVPKTDWQDFVYREGFSQKHSISASGGDEKTRFLVSGNFEDTEGHVLDNEFKRINVRSNLDHTFNSKLQGRINIGITNEVHKGVCQDGFFINCPISASAFEVPIVGPFLEDGSFNPNTRFGLSTNPAVIRDEVSRTTDIVNIIGNASATYTVKPWLNLTGTYGLDWRQTRENRFDSPLSAPAQGGRVLEINRNVFNFTTNFVANWRKTIQNDHNFSGLAGGEYRRDFQRRVTARGDGLPNGLFRVLSATATPNLTTGIANEFRIASYFGNIKYNYREKYWVTFTGRYDGSSRFGEDNRWGFFPSISASWAISQEDFFNSEFVDDLKLRASFGITGNANIGNFASRGLFGTSGSYNGVTGLNAAQLANNALTWEEAQEINVGIDYAFIESRITGSIDFYRRDTDDLLLDRQLPSDSGFNSITENVGEVRNEGIEFEIESINIDRSGFLWSTRFNIAVQKNKVLALNEGVDQIQRDNFRTSTGQIVVDRPIGVIWAPEWAGVNPADGRPMWFDKDGNITFSPNNEDFVFFDGAEDDVIGGFGNRLSYKGLSLDIFFQYAFGGTGFPSQEWFFLQTPTFTTNVWDNVNRRWREPGDITDIPRIVVGDSFRGADNFRTTQGTNAFFDTSYIRLKNVTMSYNIPQGFSEKLGIRNVRVFATGLNLITWTAWPGLDPEVAGSETAASFPSALQFNGGIELQF
jgi:TonB-dependent starch-binding outer membrane protein SusC